MTQLDQADNKKDLESQEKAPRKNKKLSAEEVEQVSGGAFQDTNTSGGNKNYFKK